MLRSDRSRAALAYWLSKSVVGRVPAKNAMDPVDMVAFLPNIVLLDMVSDHQNYRFRLVGGDVRFHLSTDVTGKLLTETAGIADEGSLMRALTECTMRQVPGAITVPYQGTHPEYNDVEILLLPLFSADHKVDRVMAILHFFQGGIADDHA